MRHPGLLQAKLQGSAASSLGTGPSWFPSEPLCLGSAALLDLQGQGWGWMCRRARPAESFHL